MSDFFADLAGLALQARAVVRPRLGTRFEPFPARTNMLEEQEAIPEGEAPRKPAPDLAARPDTLRVSPTGPVAERTSTGIQPGPRIAPSRAPLDPAAPPGASASARPPVPPAAPVRAESRVVAAIAPAGERTVAPMPSPVSPATPSQRAAATVIASAPALVLPAVARHPRESAPVPHRRGSAPSLPRPIGPEVPSERVVEITIGRVDVRAIMPSSPPVAPPARRAPELSLDDYLKQRSGGQS
jgi:hypothetical protein